MDDLCEGQADLEKESLVRKVSYFVTTRLCPLINGTCATCISCDLMKLSSVSMQFISLNAFLD